MEKVSFYPQILEKIEVELFNFYKKLYPKQKISLNKIYGLVSSKKDTNQEKIKNLGEILLEYNVISTYINPKSSIYKYIKLAREYLKLGYQNKLIEVPKEIFANDKFYKLLGYKDLRNFLSKLSFDPDYTDVARKQANLLNFGDNFEAHSLDKKFLGKYMVFFQDRTGEVHLGTALIRFNKVKHQTELILHIERADIPETERFISKYTEINGKFLIAYLKGSTHSPLVQILLSFFMNKYLLVSYTTFDQYEQKFENGFLLFQKFEETFNDRNKKNIQAEIERAKLLLIFMNKNYSFNFKPSTFFSYHSTNFKKIRFILFYRTVQKFNQVNLIITTLNNKWIFAKMQWKEKHKVKKLFGLVIANNKTRRISFYDRTNIFSKERITIYLPNTVHLDKYTLGFVEIFSDNNLCLAQCILVHSSVIDPEIKQQINLYLNGKNFSGELKTLGRLDKLVSGHYEILKEFTGQLTAILISASSNSLHVLPITITKNFTFGMNFYNKGHYKGFIEIEHNYLKFIITYPHRIDMFLTDYYDTLIGTYTGINYKNTFTSGKILIIKDRIYDSAKQISLSQDIDKLPDDLVNILRKYKNAFEFITKNQIENYKTDNPAVYHSLSEILKKL